MSIRVFLLWQSDVIEAIIWLIGLAKLRAVAQFSLRACLKIPAVDLRDLQQAVSFGKMPVKAAISLRKATLLDLGGLAI